jgi:YVTN family beta-propeller protein
VYVTNEQGGDLTVIAGGTNQVVTTIPLGKRPRGIKVSHDGTKLFVALSGSPIAPPGIDESKLPPPDRAADGIGIVDIAARKVASVLTSGSDPEQLSLSADGTKLYVSNEDAGEMSVIDIAPTRSSAAPRSVGNRKG